MKEQGLPVENYVAPNTLTNGDGEEFEDNIICSHEGHKKMDDRAANVHNISTETSNHAHRVDMHGSSKY